MPKLLGIAVAAILGFFLVLAVIGVIRRLFSGLSAAKERDYRLVDSLLTRSELACYLVLREAVGDDWQILLKVRLGDVLTVVHQGGNPDWQRAWNRIRSKHLDFLLCDPETLAPVLAIELDDRSHERQDRRERDEFLNAALADAGLPLLRIPVARAYQVADLRTQMDQLLPQGSR